MKINFITAGLTAAMIATSIVAPMFVPTKMLADIHGPVNVQEIIPVSFGGWRMIDDGKHGSIVSPQVEQMLSEIYDGTLTRTYRNNSGKTVMLSIAYGGNQNRELQLHRPEVCYAAQGFKVKNIVKDAMKIPGVGEIQVKHMLAVNGPRVEPVTYWMRVGDYVLSSGLEQALTRYRYGLTGYIADGLLVRISSIDSNEEAAYELHREFARDMLGSIAASDLHDMIGSTSASRGGS